MMRWIGGAIALGFLALLAAWNVPVRTEVGYTCVVCRLARADFIVFGIARSEYRPTECSRWYSEHVEPSHAHVWEPGTCAVTKNIFGRWLEIGCRPGHYPIHRLDADVQMRVYQHFKDPLEARRLFENLTDEKTYNDRLDEDDENRGQLTVDALKEWDSCGFPGTWGEWWDDFHARHVQGREDLAAWHKADTHLKFDEWRKRRMPGAE